MTFSLYTILGLVALCMGLSGLWTGKVIAGSRGLSANYYAREESPLPFYFFVVMYLGIGVVVLVHSW